jgi:hypothetical protein
MNVVPLPLSSHRGLHGYSPSKLFVLEPHSCALDSNRVSPGYPGRKELKNSAAAKWIRETLEPAASAPERAAACRGVCLYRSSASSAAFCASSSLARVLRTGRQDRTTSGHLQGRLWRGMGCGESLQVCAFQAGTPPALRVGANQRFLISDFFGSESGIRLQRLQFPLKPGNRKPSICPSREDWWYRIAATWLHRALACSAVAPSVGEW